MQDLFDGLSGLLTEFIVVVNMIEKIIHRQTNIRNTMVS